MQKISLKSVIFSGLLLVAVYFAITISHSSREIETTQKTVINGSGEMDSLVRLDTYAKSGTSWGMSPFGSGAPLTEDEIKTPNTEWKSLTISGVTYVFGNGNPMQVALSKDDLQTLLKKCSDTSLMGSQNPDEYREYYPYPCNEEDEYMTQDVEKYIKLALQDKNWKPLLTECKDNLTTDYITEPATSPYVKNTSYDAMAYEDYLDINKFIYIDVNGRKRLDATRAYAVRDFLYIHSMSILEGNQKPKIPMKNGLNCVDKYSSGITENLNNAISANGALDGVR